LKAELLTSYIKRLGIEVITGVPDSTLKEFCDYIHAEEKELASYTAPNEGAAVGIAAGVYLGTGKPACVYMQNSGIGNAVNPITSIAHAEVYNIPMFFIVGYRGSVDLKDEPQHKFMGRITETMLGCLEIEYTVIDNSVTESRMDEIFQNVSAALKGGKQYALVIKRDTFDKRADTRYENEYTLNREYVISEIIKNTGSNDLIVSSTGKISREVYEQSDKIWGRHNQCFLTVGGMGHASMIAFGVARKNPHKRIICIDGDGAILMHMGSLAFLGKQGAGNLIHICLNNDAHESVGGMPTAAVGFNYAQAAKACGYPDAFVIQTNDELNSLMNNFSSLKRLTFIEIKVANGSSGDLGRPKESAADNALNFMQYIQHGQF